MKLFTTALALEYLGPDYQYTTRLASTDSSSMATLQELYLIGSGDPSLSTRDLTDLAQQLHQQGVRHINTIICDASLFDDMQSGKAGCGMTSPIKILLPSVACH
jgi:D-alanyl-D-alanine carboxypeptidase/D-alanyl-D-alanine-endopeptidase (penicillin-binding protein 4)